MRIRRLVPSSVFWMVVAGCVASAWGWRAVAPEAIALPGIENAYRLAPGLYSGAQPEGEKAFEALQKLGVKTILTVDGAAPDVETARKYGIRYVHMPIGYDGMSRDQAVRIAEVSRRFPGPLFVHCHHGLHRGPAAAGVCAIARAGWSPGEAVDWLKRAGTDPRYQGLYESLREFQVPSEAERSRVAGEFPERAAVPALVELMIGMDRQGDALKASRTAGMDAVARDRRRVDELVGAASLLREGFRESLRLAESEERGPAFVEAMTAAEAHAASLQSAMERLSRSPGDSAREAAGEAIAVSLNDCKSCHAAHRDTKPAG